MTDPALFQLAPLTRRAPQPWRCDLCTFTYTSPLPLAHPPNHRCAPPGRIPRIRKMTPGDDCECQRRPDAGHGYQADCKG